MTPPPAVRLRTATEPPTIAEKVPPPEHGQVLIQVRDLTKHFPILSGAVLRRQVGAVQAVDRISFDIHSGETLGLVGESGCGKSTAGRTILQLHRPTAGSVYYQGQDITHMDRRQLNSLRRNWQIIFQDPYASLNPRFTVGDIVSEPLEVHHIGSDQERRVRVQELLSLVGLNPGFINRYPHEFSGGQRQRIGIARALALEPEFIVCDEPISALDVSIQAQVVNLLEELQHKLGLTYLFIAHDLSMVRHISNRTIVMYLGKLVELAPTEELYTHPLHPYAQALLSAVPQPNPKLERRRQRIILQGDVPSAAHPPTGCRFHPRCSRAVALCKSVTPEWQEITQGHWVACHLAE